MARRNDHSAAELKQLALAAARTIASEEGLRGVTVRRVAERIGYAPGTIYNLFANLDDLIVQVNGETLRGLGAALAQVGGGDPSTRARRMTDAYFDYVELAPRLWAMLFDHRLPDGVGLPDWYRLELDRLIGDAARHLGPALGDRSPADARRAVVAIWASLHGIATLSVSKKLGLVADVPARELGHFIVGSIVSGAATDGRLNSSDIVQSYSKI
ncbi:MAG: TetR/AcrR family transcriptional regulator [Rhizobiales bacterium]|nr:TetR/AcrR family transcriptional regulator [Hyphomicrobiales bacterium]